MRTLTLKEEVATEIRNVELLLSPRTINCLIDYPTENYIVSIPSKY